MSGKKSRGQFYTRNAEYILDGFPEPPVSAQRIIEPFAGQGDLLAWLEKHGRGLPVEAYDIEPKKAGIQLRDTLLSPPDYKDAWIVTNPPYLARNKSSSKEVYDLYQTNDLYKCFLWSILQQKNCAGGILLIPAGFFFSPRELDIKCRDAFLKNFHLTKVRYFEESVFDDTDTTIVAFSFVPAEAPLARQEVVWEMMPSKEVRTFQMEQRYGWIIGGDIYHLPVPEKLLFRRHVEGQALREGEQQTWITLRALDSGKQDGRICLEYKKDYVYPAKDSSRTYATLRITGRTLSEEEQIELCAGFHRFLEKKRSEFCSLFLPQYRESKEYARKRIPFELAYRIVGYLLSS